MKTTLFSLLALGVAAAMAFPADRALADEPMVLTDAQLDRVTAGGAEDVIVEFETPSGHSGGAHILFGDGSVRFHLDGQIALSVEVDVGTARPAEFVIITIGQKTLELPPRGER
jgi:prepilin-type processing-associated H-X9-DG protein